MNEDKFVLVIFAIVSAMLAGFTTANDSPIAAGFFWGSTVLFICALITWE